VSFPSGVWGGATPVDDFWSSQFRVMLRVLVYSGSWLFSDIAPKCKKIENITGVGKVTLDASIFSCGSNASVGGSESERPSAASKKILEKMIGKL